MKSCAVHIALSSEARKRTSRATSSGINLPGRHWTCSIINFGSVQAYLSSHGMSGYAVSKYGVRGVTRTLAREFGKDNIRVNTLVPGWVMTERQKRLWVDEEAEKMIDQVQCLPGRLMPEDVARLVLFLASDDSAMCTAQDFIVDAGWV